MAEIRMDNKMRALALKRAIEKACITYGLNLTIYDGRIGFVDQEEMKIVALWDAQYTMEDLEKGGGGEWDELMEEAKPDIAAAVEELRSHD